MTDDILPIEAARDSNERRERRGVGKARIDDAQGLVATGPRGEGFLFARDAVGGVRRRQNL